MVHTQGFLQSIRHTLDNNRLGEILIQKNIIDAGQLSSALAFQKETARPLGQILVERAAISRFELKMLLMRQSALRIAATAVLLTASLSCIASKRAHSEPMTGVQMVSTSAEFTRVAAYPKLLGTSEKKDRNLGAFTKWTGMFSRFDRQLKQQANISVIRKFQSDVDHYKGRSMKDMVRGVNNLVNRTQYIVDQRNWGKSDYWATPVEFLKRGGDCEDFAIAKYTALRSLGFPEERLRVAIVQDTVKNIPHAVLVAYTDEGAYILDNQIKTLVDAERKGRYRPIFSINRQAWWLHQNPTKTIVASAD
ncbi:MAG: transglutaminase-like cysteine peptidase [Bdellovibrionales bacterium]